MEIVLISIIILIIIGSINYIQNSRERQKLLSLYNEEIDSLITVKSSCRKYAFEAEDYRNKYFSKNLEIADLSNKINEQESKIRNLEKFIESKKFSIKQEKETRYPYDSEPTFHWETK